MKTSTKLTFALALVAALLSISDGAKVDEELNEGEYENEKKSFGNIFRRRKHKDDENDSVDADVDEDNSGGGLMHFMNRPEPEPITSTVTKTVQVTATATRNPVCMTVFKPKPNCFRQPGDLDVVVRPTSVVAPVLASQQPAPQIVHHYKPKEAEAIAEELRSVQPSPSVKVSLEASTKEALVNQGQDQDDDEEVLSRSVRYLSFAKATPAIGGVKDSIVDSAIEDDEDQEKDEGQGRFIRRRKTVYVTSTIMATRTKTVNNQGVTATLVAVNCVPFGSKIPLCSRGNQRNEDVENELKDMKL